jgi:hypothetical protein
MASVRSILSAALLIASLPALAENPTLHDPWQIYVGGFSATVDSEIQINNGEDVNIPVDLEDLLGVEDGKTVLWGGASWRFFKRHGVELEVFSLNRDARITDAFDPPLEIGEAIVEEGGIGTDYQTDVTRITYAFSAIARENQRLNLLAGLHWAEFSIAFALGGTICTPDTTPAQPPGCPVAQSSTERSDVSAPLPHFGVGYTYAFNDQWAINARAIGFEIEIDNIDGSIVELDADVEWRPWRRLGLGLGYRYFQVRVDAQGSDLNGAFDFDYYGPTLYLKTTF